MRVNIFSNRAGQGPPVILIHGLFGMGSNLGALARALEDRYCVYSVDLPNHGRSDWLPTMDLSTMADALLGWMDTEAIPHASFVGHSLGGKVAMELALRHPGRADALVIADIAPVVYPPGHEREFEALAAVADARCSSRAEARALMADFLEHEDVILFLLKNLRRSEDGRYLWQFNLDGLKASYGALRAAVESPGEYGGPVLFIKGANSAYIQEDHRASIQRSFPRAEMKIMPDCGHWLHAENPRLFNGLVGRFLDTHSGA